MCGLSGLAVPVRPRHVHDALRRLVPPGSIQNVTAFGARAIDDTISQTAMFQEYVVYTA